jgi:pullulanase
VESNALDGYFGPPTSKGYATGDPSSLGVVAITVAAAIDFAQNGNGFTENPDEDINLASDHDGYTLWDRLLQDPAATDETIRTKMDELTQAIVMTSQGVPFTQGGEEFLRTKAGDGNSYQSGDTVNQLDWNRKHQYASVFAYYVGLLHLRHTHPAFRMDSLSAVRTHLSFINSPSNTIAYELKGHANGDPWKNIVVVYNPSATSITTKLPSGKWTMVATQGKVGEKSLGGASDTIAVPDYSMIVLHQ